MNRLRQLFVKYLRPPGFFLFRGLRTGRLTKAFHCDRCGVLRYDAQNGVWHCRQFSMPPVIWFFVKEGSLRKQPKNGRYVQVGNWNNENAVDVWEGPPPQTEI
jgi:hypothetical protein